MALSIILILNVPILILFLSQHLPIKYIPQNFTVSSSKINIDKQVQLELKVRH